MNDFWNDIIFRIGNFTLTAGKLAAVLLIITLTWILLSIIWKITLRKRDISISEKARRISFYLLIKYIIWVAAFSLCITILGFNLTFLVAGSAALLVGIGFGLQNIFSDLISGLFMLFERKVKVGDIMEVDNIVGKVHEISLRTSTITTRDGYNIIVPNHKFITENVVNWSHQSFDRRFQVEVGVSYKSDVDLVTKVLLLCSEDQKELIKDENHKPYVRFQNFGDSSLVFCLMFWTNDIFHAEQVKSELRYKIFKAFRENKITIPFPQRDVHIIQQ